MISGLRDPPHPIIDPSCDEEKRRNNFQGLFSMDNVPSPETQQMLEQMITVSDETDKDTHIGQVLSSAEEGDLVKFTAHLDQLQAFGLDVNAEGEDGDTALHIGSLYGHLAIVKECLKRGANVMSCDEDGSTPLHDACAGGFYDIAKLLFENGAQADRKCVRTSP